MLSFLATQALLMLVVSAAPLESGHGHHHHDHGDSGPQVPFQFPLPNGFPNIQVPSSQLTAIQKQALGTLPNSPLPTSLADVSATTFQAIAFGELFEVAYFTSLLNNITNNVAGYEIGSGAVRGAVVEAISTIRAQEELHAIGVNAILSSAGRTPVGPCQYIFPVDNFDSAIAGAQAFTDAVVLGGLQDALNTFVTAGDGVVVPLLTSVVGQEGEQNGFFRLLQAHVPSALPFLTRSAGPFAFSYINQNFVVPGSCQTQINVPIFSPLKLLSSNIQGTNIQPRDQQLSFSFSNDQKTSTNGLSLVYINQQNLPIIVPLKGVKSSGGEVTFQANFPYSENEMNGLTIAVLTQGAEPFANVDAVANATIYGPAIIEIK